jgi:Ring finger domain
MMSAAMTGTTSSRGEVHDDHSDHDDSESGDGDSDTARSSNHGIRVAVAFDYRRRRNESTPSMPRPPPEQQQQPPPEPVGLSSLTGPSRVGMFQTISSLTVSVLLVLFVLFPAVIIVMGLVGVCLIPVLLALCVGLGLYFCAPDTVSTVALVWGTGGEGSSQPQRRWDVDWTLANYRMEHSLEPKSRTDLEKELIVKRVVPADDAHGPDKDHQVQNQHQQQTNNPSRSHDEEQPQTIETIETPNSPVVDDKLATEAATTSTTTTTDIETGCHSVTARALKHIIRGNKKKQKDILHNNNSNSSWFDSTTMMRLNHIPQSCCDICMMDYEVNDMICESKNSECDHIFHKECILDWMQKKHSCPCCRRNYLGGDDCNDGIITPGWRENL